MGHRQDPQRVPCVGGIVLDAAGRLLMVRRGHEPDLGRWSLPGGRVEPGETDEQATVREVREETGLDVEVVGEPVGEVELPLGGGRVAVVVDFRCRPRPGTDPSDLRAGDDADDARWCTDAQLRALDCSPGLVDQLASWGILPLKTPESDGLVPPVPQAP